MDKDRRFYFNEIGRFQLLEHDGSKLGTVRDDALGASVKRIAAIDFGRHAPPADGLAFKNYGRRAKAHQFTGGRKPGNPGANDSDPQRISP